MAKKNLLSYLDINSSENKIPVLLSQEDINKQYSSGSELFEKDYSKYQQYLQQNNQPVYDSPETWNDKRAMAQSGFEKVLNSTGQMVGTFGTALASTVATLGGAVAGGIGQLDDLRTGEDNTDFMDTMINNPVMKGISDFDKYIKEEIVPTYYTKEQQESIFSAATGTDLLNGIGFMASAILPNAAIVKLFGSLGKMAAVAKLGKLESTLASAVTAGDITSVQAGIISKTANYLNKVGPIVGATVGRIGESSMEAYQTYEDMLSNGATEEEAKQGRNNVFMGNMALAASDLAQYTRWFKGNKLGDDLIKNGLSTTVKNKSKAELLGGFLKESSQEAAEEGYQFLLSEGAKKSGRGKSFIDGISEASNDLFTTTEGLKSMLLGAVLGGGMGAISEVRNSKKHKEQLSSMAKELTKVGDTSQRYIENEDGKRIINPELTKIATQFAHFEQLKENALEQGDNNSYNVLEKIQFANLVEAKNRAGQFDEFIDQLESMGRSNPEEIKAMFGELPIKNGKEMIPLEVATTKIAQAKQIKQMSEGLDFLPQLNKKDENGNSYIDATTKKYIRNKLFTQEALREEILDLNRQIAEVQSRAKIDPVAVENNELFEPELLPQDQEELNNLVESKKALEKNFLEIAKEFKSFIAKPELAKKEVDDIQDNNVKTAIKTEETIINKDRDVTNQAKDKLEELKQLADEPIIVETENGNIEAILQDGILVNAETGEPIEDELIEQFKKQTVDSELIETDDLAPEEYEETKDDFLKGPKKPDNYSTSTRGLDINYTESSSGHYAKEVNTLFQYVLYESHKLITKWFSNPKNTPSKDKVYTVKLTEEPITEELLNDINTRRLSLNSNTGNYPQLTLEDLQSPRYKPLRMWLYENGKLVKESEDNVIHFHDVDYLYNTQAFEKLTPEEFEIELQKLTEERAKIIDNLDVVVLTVDKKSNGVFNFLPNIKVDNVSKRRVLPISNLANQENSYGIGYVESINEKTATIVYSNGEKIESNNPNLKLGEIVFDTITANGEHMACNKVTKNRYTSEQIESIADLIMYKLISGTDSITVDGKSIDIKELLRKFIFLGINENKPENTIGFSKDILLLGRDKKVNGSYDNSSKWTKERALNDQVTLRNSLIAMLNTDYHSFPNPSIKELNKNSEVILPTEISATGTAKGKVITMQEMFLQGKNPLIGTNINPNMPFINSYFSFEVNGGGLVFETKPEKLKSYGSNLNNETKNDGGNSVGGEVNVNKERERLKNKLEKLEYNIPNSSGKIRLNKDGSFKEYGDYENGAWRKVTDDINFGSIKYDYDKVKKLYDVDIKLNDLVNSKLSNDLIFLKEKLGGLKALKKAFEDFSFEQIGSTANLDMGIELFLKQALQFNKLEGLENAVKAVEQSLKEQTKAEGNKEEKKDDIEKPVITEAEQNVARKINENDVNCSNNGKGANLPKKVTFKFKK